MSHLHFVRVVTVLALLAPGLEGTARAASPGPVRREAIQVHRIAAGVASGSLTRAETRRLGREQRQIRHDVARARADGHVTVGEAVTIRRELDRQSRRIFVEKHDARRRPAPSSIPARQVRQDARIDQGIASGELTPRETLVVRAGQAVIEHRVEKAKADGRVTAAERLRLQRDLNLESDLIFTQKRH